MKVLNISITIALLTGCSANIVEKNYIADTSKQLTEVKFEMLNPSGNNELMDFSLITQSSCDEKPILNKVSHLSNILFSKKTSETQKLPLNEVLNIHFENSSYSGPLSYQCQSLASYRLEKGYRYSVKAKNLNPNKNECGYKLYRSNKNGGGLREVSPIKTNLPSCRK